MDSAALYNSFAKTSSWCAYTMTDVQSPLRVSNIQRNCEELNDSYITELEYTCVNGILCVLVSLKKKVASKNTKRKDETKRPNSEKFDTYKVAICDDDDLVFFSRTLASKTEDLFLTILGCSALTPETLTGSNFTRLLLLHRDALTFEKDIKLLVEKTHKDQRLKGEELTTDTKNIFGTKGSPFPQINQISFNVEACPLITRDIKLTRFTRAKITGPSIYHLYQDFVRNNFIRGIPKWVRATRSQAKTHLRVKF